MRDLKLDRNTLVIFSADNGGTPRAVNAPLRGNKGSTWEGGMRVPTIAGWPDRIPAGTSTDEVTGMLDILPTFAKLGGGQASTDRTLDGLDSSPVLLDEPGAEGHGDFHFFRGFNLEAVRSGPWKLHFGTPAVGTAGKAKRAAAAKANPDAPPAGLKFFNLDSDIGESQNVAEAHPDVVQGLQALADVMHADLGTREVGPGMRPLGGGADPLPFLDRDGTVRASAVGSCKNFP